MIGDRTPATTTHAAGRRTATETAMSAGAARHDMHCIFSSRIKPASGGAALRKNLSLHSGLSR